MDSREKRMKVLMISDAPQSNSGYGKLTKVWAKHLLKQGHEVLVMGGTSPQAQIPFQEQDYEGIRTWMVPGYGHAEHIRYFLADERPDIVLANADPRFFEYLFKIDNEIRRQCPLAFYHLWDDDPFPDFNMPVYLSCDGILCGSKFTYDLLQGYEDLSRRNNIFYTPIGIDTDTYKPLPAADRQAFRKEFNAFTKDRYLNARFIVGVVGRHAERKQLLSILESFNNWSKGKDDVLLFIHTPGADQGDSLGYALQMRYGDTDKIVYSNAAPHRQTDELINKFYNFFDVLVNRSNAEGFGLPIAEAMAAGVPCISIDNMGPRGLITAENGWLLEADCTPLIGNFITPYIYSRYVTDTKFEGALDFAYNNKGIRDSKAVNCRPHIEQYYNQAQMVNNVEKALLDIISAFKPFPEFTITTWPNMRRVLQMDDILEEVK